MVKRNDLMAEAPTLTVTSRVYQVQVAVNSLTFVLDGAPDDHIVADEKAQSGNAVEATVDEINRRLISIVDQLDAVTTRLRKLVSSL